MDLRKRVVRSAEGRHQRHGTLELRAGRRHVAGGDGKPAESVPRGRLGVGHGDGEVVRRARLGQPPGIEQRVGMTQRRAAVTAPARRPCRSTRRPRRGDPCGSPACPRGPTRRRRWAQAAGPPHRPWRQARTAPTRATRGRVARPRPRRSGGAWRLRAPRQSGCGRRSDTCRREWFASRPPAAASGPTPAAGRRGARRAHGHYSTSEAARRAADPGERRCTVGDVHDPRSRADNEKAPAACRLPGRRSPHEGRRQSR